MNEQAPQQVRRRLKLRAWTPVFRSITRSEQMADLPDNECRLFFVMLLTCVDSWGHFELDLDLINSTVWPLLKRSDTDTRRCLLELERVGMIRGYSQDGVAWLEITKWEEKAGTILRKRGAPKFPPPTPAPERQTLDPRLLYTDQDRYLYALQQGRRAASIRQERLRAARLKGTHTCEEWEVLLTVAQGHCPRCGALAGSLQKDHIVPLCYGGSDAIENIQPLCRACNCSKGRETTDWLAKRGLR